MTNTDRPTITYLTGCSTPLTREADRADLGLLCTPATGIYRQRDHYAGGWAADNGCFAEKHRPTRDEVRYELPNAHEAVDWLAKLDPAGCLFATLPDVVGDYRATWERSAMFVAKVRALGFPVAIVLQDGVETDRFVWGSILNAADAVFIGGSTEWKLGPAVVDLVAEAKARGLWCHMGRVNSLKRLRYAASIGCDSADGTCVGFGPSIVGPKLLGWLDTVNATPTLDLAA